MIGAIQGILRGAAVHANEKRPYDRRRRVALEGGAVTHNSTNTDVTRRLCKGADDSR